MVGLDIPLKNCLTSFEQHFIRKNLSDNLGSLGLKELAYILVVFNVTRNFKVKSSLGGVGQIFDELVKSSNPDYLKTVHNFVLNGNI